MGGGSIEWTLKSPTSTKQKHQKMWEEGGTNNYKRSFGIREKNLPSNWKTNSNEEGWEHTIRVTMLTTSLSPSFIPR